ncbi:uncharacterized protein PFL1_02746 [Pseudozyma flocculosa PF-1]|uniref:Uncharacterized protein n=2 Tax=Pseudozyma flocculosa TaxID=84751 RepID=A0A5C3F3N8_9BASI|nr:uncharacterized protein PFL1_02746 [Pseudozyma flocculosa PF-1]EPQ29527.1 hypothetical protein PFL1_02746 [Pseudozyma flocculosa PF-1]SPO38069.1 uncharacterized protein PSFLO_03546 [Pseudozyma flocculosa]
MASTILVATLVAVLEPSVVGAGNGLLDDLHPTLEGSSELYHRLTHIEDAGSLLQGAELAAPGPRLLDDLPQSPDGLGRLYESLGYIDHATPAMLQAEHAAGKEQASHDPHVHDAFPGNPSGSLAAGAASSIPQSHDNLAVQSHDHRAELSARYDEGSTSIEPLLVEGSPLSLPRGRARGGSKLRQSRAGKQMTELYHAQAGLKRKKITYGNAELSDFVVEALQRRVRDLPPSVRLDRETIIRIHQPSTLRGTDRWVRVRKAAGNLFKNQAVPLDKSGLLTDIDVPGRCRVSFSYIVDQPRNGVTFLFDAAAFPYKDSGLERTYLGILEIREPPEFSIVTDHFSPVLAGRLQALTGKRFELERVSASSARPGGPIGPADDLHSGLDP